MSAGALEPYRPLLRHVVLDHVVERLAAHVGLDRALHPEVLLDGARRATGLEDLGPDFDPEALDRLLDAARGEAELHRAGRLIAHHLVLRALVDRLLATELVARDPTRAAPRVDPPIVIVGLHRSGTTLLHRALAAQPGARWLPLWLLLSPLPVPSVRDWARGDVPRRSNGALASAAWNHVLAPHFPEAHETAAHLPEEEGVMLAPSLRAAHFFNVLPVPSYLRWVLEQDARPTYRLLRTLLGAYQRTLPGDRWVLKTPCHLPFLDALLDVFPDARLVLTWRDPAVSVPSYYGLLESNHEGLTLRPRRHDVVAAADALCGRGLDAMRRVRERLPAHQYVDVPYEELVADPPAMVRRIHERFALPPVEAVPVAAPPRRRAARAAPERWGTTAEALRERFGAGPP